MGRDVQKGDSLFFCPFHFLGGKRRGRWALLGQAATERQHARLESRELAQNPVSGELGALGGSLLGCDLRGCRRRWVRTRSRAMGAGLPRGRR